MHNPKVMDFGNCVLQDSLRGSEQVDGSIN